MTAIAIRERETIISRIAHGEDLRQIAQSMSVTPAAISQYLASDPEYVQARQHGISQKIEECEQEIKTADDALNLARARERFRVVSWRAEREFPERWGQRTHVVVDDAQSYRDVLRTVAEVRQSRIRHVMSNDTNATLVSGTEQDSCARDQDETK